MFIFIYYIESYVHFAGEIGKNRAKMQRNIFYLLYEICLLYKISLKGIDYLQVFFFIIEPRGLKFGMRM